MADPRPNLLTFTDRTRCTTRHGQCAHRAYLSTMWGPHGYGLQPRRTGSPLASGTMLHDGMALIMEHCLAHDLEPDAAVINTAVAVATTKYRQLAEKRRVGYWDEGDDPEYLHHVLEQQVLIEALLWAFCVEKLPAILEDHQVVSVEQEEVTVYACTCGLGEHGMWEEHVENGCEGIGFQHKADCIMQSRRNPDHFSYHEFKTSGLYADGFLAKYETDIQPFLGARGWEHRNNHQVIAAYVHGLLKGQRKRIYQDGGYNGPDRQNSLLVYGYCDPGAPPLTDPSWAYAYEYVGADGKNKRLPRSYQKTLTSEYPGGVQAWVLGMPAELRQPSLVTAGPLPRRNIDLTMRGFVHAEEAARVARWEINDAIAEAGGDWTAQAVQELIAIHFPRSWNCRPYGKRHQCPFVPICLRQAGWEDPLSMSFDVRRPHHQPELEQAIERGLILPEDTDDEPDTDD